jgi:phosphoglucosamine mutase
MDSKRRFFGTDGIRARANSEPMSADIAQKVGMAAGHIFNRGSHRHRVVIAKDTRLSGYMIENALTSGFLSVGIDVLLVGPMPTPAVAFLVQAMRADIGVMISASHNAYLDNGIKLFGPDGYKLSDALELEIETLMLSDLSKTRSTAENIGRAKRLDDAPGRYIEFVKSAFSQTQTLEGLKIVIDCAHGAGYVVGPIILQELGAEIIPLCVTPDGTNINDNCGSTYPETLQQAVLREKADLGIALDGDADRLIMVDEKGQLIDGDQLIAMVATHWHKHGLLKGGGVVTTQMANHGFEQYLKSIGLGMVRTQVGDRYVMEAMRKGGYNLGGEPSGHIILSDYVTTGDALIAALQILAMMRETGKKMSDASDIFTPTPQVLHNVPFPKNTKPLADAKVMAAIEEVSAKLGDSGRVMVRASGTEPVIRIMIQGPNQDVIHGYAQHIAQVMAQVSAPIDAPELAANITKNKTA